MVNLSNRIALVTGASKGIGAGIARHLAQCGAAVAVNYATSPAGADRVVAQIKAAGGQAIPVGADVSKKAHVERMFAEVHAKLGRIDIVINNAGRYLLGRWRA